MRHLEEGLRMARREGSAAFTLKILGGDRLSKLLERAKEQRYYTVPWPVAEFDTPTTRHG